MEYRYWIPGRSRQAPALREIKKCLKNDKPAQRQYERRVEIFEVTPYDTMIALRQITPFRNSPTKLHEWQVDLPGNRSGRMMFVISRSAAFFLHFFIKKSSRGSITPPGNLQTAEERAKLFRMEEQTEIYKN